MKKMTRLCTCLLLTALCAAIPIVAQITQPVEQPTNIARNTCNLLQVVLEKQNDGKNACCYKITLNNKLPAPTNIFPAAFQVSIRNGNITDVYAPSNVWQQMPQIVPPKTKKVVWNHAMSKIPMGQTAVATICVEGLTPVWLYYTWSDRLGKVLCKDSVKLEGCINEPTDLCDNPLIRNGEFTQNNTVTQFWAKGYGNPKFLNTPNEGCFDAGYAEFSGNQTSGDAVSQALLPTNKIKQKTKYQLSVGVRFLTRLNTLDYARIRAVAYNGVLPLTGTHPLPSANMAIIGRSGKIKDCGDWSVIEFPVWVANKDFQNIAINVFTNDGTVAKLWIDNVTLCEVAQGSDCDEVALDSNGKPIIPTGFGTVPAGFICTAEAENDEYYNGSLSDLYGGLYGYDGTTNWYGQATDKCFSIGGTLPPEVVNYNCDDSLKQAGYNITCADLEKILDKANVGAPDPVRPPPLPPIPPLQNTCQSKLPNEYDQMAFKGKDIIYIHGLQLKHLSERAMLKQGADANWPDKPYEFYFGYYKDVADKNWLHHIEHFLRGKGNNNRYLIVTYNCSQKLDVAVHAVLSQIREAMEKGTGVVYDKFDPRKDSCFGRGYIAVSTSTGSIVGDVALTIANRTKTNPALQTKYGNIGLIADRCKGHMAIRGAMSGSNLATILLLVGSQAPPALVKRITLELTDGVFQTDFSTGANRNLIVESILYDLVPKNARAKWGSYINDVPVPVVTISSGHPTALLGNLKPMIHPGFDDGVLSMDCTSGRINPSSIHPAAFTPTSAVKVYDMGIIPDRAITYYLDQRSSLGRFAIASTPYLSPTGMVQPVSSFITIPQYRNHFTFVQSAAEHLLPSKNAYFVGCNYMPTAMIGGWPNYEEELVVSNASLYANGIVSPSIIGEMGESIKGMSIPMLYIKIKRRHGIPIPRVYVKWVYIWKRTYHKLNDNCMYDCDFGYKYLFKN